METYLLCIFLSCPKICSYMTMKNTFNTYIIKPCAIFVHLWSVSLGKIRSTNNKPFSSNCEPSCWRCWVLRLLKQCNEQFTWVLDVGQSSWPRVDKLCLLIGFFNKEIGAEFTFKCSYKFSGIFKLLSQLGLICFYLLYSPSFISILTFLFDSKRSVKV